MERVVVCLNGITAKAVVMRLDGSRLQRRLPARVRCQRRLLQMRIFEDGRRAARSSERG